MPVDPRIGELIATVDPTNWAQAPEQAIVDATQHRFFFFDLSRLRVDLHQLMFGVRQLASVQRKEKFAGNFRVDSALLQNAFRQGKQTAVSLSDVAALNRMLEAAANSPNERVAKACRVRPRGERYTDIPFTLPNDCIIPSLYHVDADELMNARDSVGLRSTKEASLALLDDARVDTISRLEVGTRISTHPGQRQNLRRRFRITKRTATKIHASLVNLSNTKGVAPPNWDNLFDDSQLANGGYNYTIPLSPSNGNIIAA